jgi:hypothetical protein
MPDTEFKPGDRVRANALWYANLPEGDKDLKWPEGVVVSPEEWARGTAEKAEKAFHQCVLVKHDEQAPFCKDEWVQWHPSLLEHCGSTSAPTGRHKCRCPREVLLIQGCQCGGK